VSAATKPGFMSASLLAALPNGSRLSCGHLDPPAHLWLNDSWRSRAQQHNGFLKDDHARQLQAHVRPHASQTLVESSPAKCRLAHSRARDMCRVAVVAPLPGEVNLATRAAPLARSTVAVWPIGIVDRELSPAAAAARRPVQAGPPSAIEAVWGGDDDYASVLRLRVGKYFSGGVGHSSIRSPSGAPQRGHGVTDRSSILER
jgi:hypothetical protein